MDQTQRRFSLTATIDDFLASQGVDASARVIRGTSSVYVIVTLNPVQTPIFLTQRHRSISDQLTAFIKLKIDSAWSLEGIFWGFKKELIGSVELQTQSAALTEKIRELRLSRSGVDQSSEF